MKYRALTAWLVLSMAIVSCSSDDKEEACVFIPDTAGSRVATQFQPFEDSVVNFKSKKELVAFFTRQPVLRDYFFHRAEYPGDSVFINEVYNRLTNPHLDTLLQDTRKIFGDGSALKKQFDDAFANVKYYYPDFVPPKIQTVISGLDTDLFVSDSLIIVGLDYYLGKGARYRPKTYDYLLRKYDSDDIVPSCMLLLGIDGRINKTSIQDKTVLADMIAYGKSFYFAKHMLPCVADSTLIWYTPEEIRGSRKNEDLIWARFIQSNVLFATSHVIKKDYLAERPITVQVGEKCPGRIGQWVGWRIVQKYMETHPDVTLQQLMDMQDAQKLFKESRYKPERK
jgi:hypothetical protein